MRIPATLLLVLLLNSCSNGNAVEIDLGFHSKLKNWGLINGQAKSHINAIDAWKLTKGSRSILVAVIDTGLDVSHPAFKESVWHSPKDKTIYGWNYVTDKFNPVDEHGHGTHVAGIIAAAYDENAGISGVAPGVHILPIKYYSDANPGSVNLKNTVKAINYAVEQHVNIINYSGGGPEFSEDEFMALRKAEAKGILVITAAGNEHQDTDKQENYYYPSAYRLSNIISVAATDIRNNLLATSNWGKKRVDVAAPGENIYSTLPNGRFGYMSGTSQATAFVSGIAALIMSCNRNLTMTQVRDIIVNSVDRFPQLEDRVASGGRVDAIVALEAAAVRGKCPSH